MSVGHLLPHTASPGERWRFLLLVIHLTVTTPRAGQPVPALFTLYCQSLVYQAHRRSNIYWINN